ncbi:hypothetical protein VNI00_018736 [Paramarasmius palmivorus]|uniref:Uncharacterized protein n=1 Tax=Paramarasmius palmivorus TaxID=297713 RepID=A0AAW0AV58_9AGAR
MADIAQMQANILAQCTASIKHISIRTDGLHPCVYRAFRALSFAKMTVARLPIEACISPVVVIHSQEKIMKLTMLSKPLLRKPHNHTTCSPERSTWEALTRLHIDISGSMTWMFNRRASAPCWRSMSRLKEVSVSFNCSNQSIVQAIQHIDIPAHWEIFAVFFQHGWDDFFVRRLLPQATFHTKFVAVDIEPVQSWLGDSETQEAWLFHTTMTRIAIDGRGFSSWDDFWLKVRQHISSRNLESTVFHNKDLCILFK